MRFGFQFLANKSSVETAKTLPELLQQHSVPYSIWTDTGKGFERDFRGLLEQRGIRQIYSASQQNGKCERFWRAIEMGPKAKDVLNLIAQYNQTPHFRLP
jgi:transposase InsO family protein